MTDQAKKKLARVFLHLAWIVPATLLAIYLWNPLGIPTWDPRGRLAGVIPYSVPSDSMAPTVIRGSHVLACTAAYVRGEPAIGDIVVFRSPPPEGAVYFKRVVGVGGDTVRFTATRFLRNGKPQDEPYVMPDDQAIEEFEATVPTGTVFVAGDNRAHSSDSRHFGPVPLRSIIGKVCRIL